MYEAYIGKKVYIGTYSAIIIDVIVVNSQIASFKIKDNNDQIQLVNARDVHIEGFDQMSNTAYLYSATGNQMRDVLREWLNGQRDFRQSDWSCIEKICMNIAKIAQNVLIERIGENCRFVLPPQPFAPTDSTLTCTYINLHSINHNDVRTLIVTITENKDEQYTQELQHVFSSNRAIGHSDPWVRSMKWALVIVDMLGGTTAYMKEKLQKVNLLHKIRRYWQPKIIAAYKKVIAPRLFCFKKNPQYPYITICVNAWALPAGKIGMYEYPNGHFKCGVLIINPLAFTMKAPVGDLPYYEYVIMHELIHALLDQRCNQLHHGPDFIKIAEEIGLPKKYCD